VNDIGMNDIHRVRLFPLSLSSTAFNWFTSLAPNSISTWAHIEEKFHEYFYNGEMELKLSDLTSVRQKYNESVVDYIRRFRETRNRCYGLIVGERDLADLDMAELLSYLRDKLEGQEFTDVNQVMQHAFAQENRARDGRSVGRFRDNGKEKE
jgi:hypothetical protein